MNDAARPGPQRRALLRPSEVAMIFRVAPRTVARWADSGRLTVVRTPGGHRRYPAEDVIDLLTLERRVKPELPAGDEIDLTEETVIVRDVPARVEAGLVGEAPESPRR